MMKTERRVLEMLSEFNVDHLDLKLTISNEVLRDRTLYTLPDCAARRRLFTVVEALLMGLWQESFFGRVALEQQAQLFVVLIFGILKETLPKIRFNSEMFWFGGEQKRLKTDPLNNSLSFLSACWHIAALALRSSVSGEIEPFLHASCSLVPATSCLPMALLAHDERCLSCAVALLHLQQANINLPSQLNPLLIFRHILYSIGYDHKVILDWLYSEVTAIPFVLRFSKALIVEEQGENTFLSCQCCEMDQKQHFERRKADKSDNSITLHIKQLHGDLPVAISYTFQKCEGKTELVKPKSLCEAPDDRRISECFKRLRDSCISLQKSSHAPFNVKPIVASVEQLEKKIF